ncbi:MAG: aminotransferase class I/II-fold pyridoxal phosphate-dependent enzyme [Rhodospirillaceae bacterium]|jgi:histidinol-phosphate aminotransferase|nr:aminotransferase class I/II-fold pyridoxal phosphate-dependent enzyme [Rhodospirillaceae bacterium]
MPNDSVDPKLLLRDEISNLPNIKLGVKYDEFAKANPDLELIRLGSNENPYGPSPRVLEAIQQHLSEVNLYPDNTCADIAVKMAEQLGVDPARLIFDCGAESILVLLLNLCLRPGDKVVSMSPSFPVINIFSAAVGAEVIGVPHEDDLTFSADKFCEALQDNVRMLYLCMPNNPTGSYFTGPDLEKIVAAASPETLFVLDEAYVEFAQDKPDFPDAIRILESAGQPYISLRTMSKAYALAGMRIGYGIGYSEEFTGLLKRANTVFNVGVLTLKAAEAALEDKAHLEKYLSAVSSEKARLEQELGSRGVRLFNSAGNFICVSLPTLEQAQAVEAGMQQSGIFIKAQKGRELASQGSEGVLRITIGKPAENDRMLAELLALI